MGPLVALGFGIQLTGKAVGQEMVPIVFPELVELELGVDEVEFELDGVDSDWVAAGCGIQLVSNSLGQLIVSTVVGLSVLISVFHQLQGNSLLIVGTSELENSVFHQLGNSEFHQVIGNSELIVGYSELMVGNSELGQVKGYSVFHEDGK